MMQAKEGIVLDKDSDIELTHDKNYRANPFFSQQTLHSSVKVFQPTSLLGKLAVMILFPILLFGLIVFLILLLIGFFIRSLFLRRAR